MSDILRWLVDMAARFTRSLDWVLCLTLGGLMAIGLSVLKSAGGTANGQHLLQAQAIRFVIGTAAMWGISRMSVLRLRAWTPWVYGLSMLPLLAVFALGTGKYGRQWLDLKVFYLQPAEIGRESCRERV